MLLLKLRNKLCCHEWNIPVFGRRKDTKLHEIRQVENG